MNIVALREKVIDLAIRGKLINQGNNQIHVQKIIEINNKLIDNKKTSLIYKNNEGSYFENSNNVIKCIDDEIPFKLPDSWCWCRGYTCFKGMESKKPLGEYFDYIDIDAIDNKNHRVKNPKRVLVKEAPSRASRKLNKGSVIFSMVRPYLENIALIDENLSNCIASTGFYICNPFEFLDSKYLFILMTSKYTISGVNQYMKGDNSPSIKQGDIENWLYPIPPLEEQRRIVEVVEKYNKLIDEIDNSSNEIDNLVNIAKSKILDLAITGKLDSQNNENEDASVLLECIKNEKEELIKQGKIKCDKNTSVVLKNADASYYENLPAHWSVTTLREITNNTTLNDGDWILSDNMSDSGTIKLIQLGSIGFMKYIDKGFKYITEDTFKELSCTQIKPKYMLINRIVGDKMCACILPDIEGKIITTVDTCWIAPNDLNYNLKYLLYVLSAPKFQSIMMLNTAGVTRKRISKNNLISLPIPFPPLAEQSRIVEKVDNYFNILDSIERFLS